MFIFWKYQFEIIVGATPVVSEVFSCSPQFLQGASGLCFKSGSERFLSYSFEFNGH
jgi:hypothetical protein